MMQIMSMMKFLLKYGIDVGSFLGLTALMIPFIASIIVPFVCFIAVIFVYNKMIADNEITVMAASGLSPRQIAKPALRLGAILMLLNLALNIWIVPASQSLFYDRQWDMQYGMAHMKLQEGAFTEISNGLVVYVEKVAGHDLSQVMLSDMRGVDRGVVGKSFVLLRWIVPPNWPSHEPTRSSMFQHHILVPLSASQIQDWVHCLATRFG